MLQANSSNYLPILYRCFWMLQYYFVYYGYQIRPEICTISRHTSPVSYASSQFIELFPLETQKSRHVYFALEKTCAPFSDFFHARMPETLDLLSLARIILDVIIEQINLRKNLSLDKIADASDLKEQKNQSIIEMDQYTEFQKLVGGFGSHSYDRLNMIKRFAPTNCYAAEELADIYYWGRTFVVRRDDYYDVESDYEKAVEWYQKAIENSNPPLQSACWSLGYTLTNIRYKTDTERKAAVQKALSYFHLAGEYPPAFGRIANHLFDEAELDYKERPHDESSYEDILLKFMAAVRLADRAGKMHWFYGNNRIAVFLMAHEHDTRLLSDLKKRLTLHVPLDIEAQLSYAASYHNPWATRRLAIRYMEQKRKKEAKELLLQAMESNYNAAYYEMARFFHKEGSAKWRMLMEKASALSYPLATHALATVETDSSERYRLIQLARQQIFSEKEIDNELLNSVNVLAGDIRS
ncbi:MAG: SEL1-like repeat protein [Lachnospiraceae bacterium]|nr:SEL1-like repeat protein [Lachnospiraceae bacterium]